MNVLLLQLDGKIPNIALMRVAAHHRAIGDTVVFRWGRTHDEASPEIFDGQPGRVYASLIFEKTRPLAEAVLAMYPHAILGGTGWDMKVKLEDYGIETHQQDYSIYPRWQQSIGFTQRGCRLSCSFCVVPRKEGKVREECTITEIWRGGDAPRELILLDNDFFGQPRWRDRIEEIRAGNFKVSFNQGINARFIGEEEARAIASVDYRADDMKVRRIYTAWDNRRDEERLFRGLSLLKENGVNPDHIMVYILIGYWPNESAEDWNYRRWRLREFGARPYPMPFVRTLEAVGFQRFVVGAYDKRFTWQQWKAANYRPEQLGVAHA